MSEYISREAAYNAIVNNYTTDAQLRDLDGIPAADVVEVRHGRWINERREGLGSFSSECSLCGKRTLAYFHYFYCPNCGAKMDGGNKDEKTDEP